MNPIRKALWYIESHFNAELALDDVAAVAGVSKFYMSRMFAVATGYPVMAYVRARRLSQAAGRLAAGAPDILALALDSGYGSHEAFTRAFREQFGVTPEAVRAQGHLDNLELVEPIMMNPSTDVKLDEPGTEDLRELALAGMRQRFGASEGGGIPALWQRFAPHIGHVPGQLGFTAYGVVFDTDKSGGMDYLCGVEVGKGARLPAELTGMTVPAHRYLLFKHRGHISGIRATWMAVMNEWLPASAYQADEAPFIERYTERFDPRTGSGEVDILVPVKG